MPTDAKRTALLIRCSTQEADAIRAAARKSGRTVSGYVLYFLNKRLKAEAHVEARIQQAGYAGIVVSRRTKL